MTRFEVFRKIEFLAKDENSNYGYLKAFDNKTDAITYANKFVSVINDNWHCDVVICQATYTPVAEVTRNVTVAVTTKDL